jgi:hypothetical protein
MPSSDALHACCFFLTPHRQDILHQLVFINKTTHQQIVAATTSFTRVDNTSSQMQHDTDDNIDPVQRYDLINIGITICDGVYTVHMVLKN